MDTAQALWNAVDAYTDGTVIGADPALDAALRDSEAAGLPPIAVSPALGKFLHLMALARGATRILEVGTLGGYSTIWMARALPEGGTLVSLELTPKHAEVARANIARAGLADRVEVRVGPAIATLEALGAAKADPFDMIFIDADKASNPAYFDWAVRLANPGAVIIVDNVVRAGRILDGESAEPDVVGIRTMLEAMQKDTRIRATVLQTVGAKGHDGIAMAVVNRG